MRFILEFTISIVVTLIIITVLKKITKVSRPRNAKVHLKDYAFPSGHSGVSFAGATSFVFWANTLPEHNWLGIVASIFWIIFAILIARWRLIQEFILCFKLSPVLF